MGCYVGFLDIILHIRDPRLGLRGNDQEVPKYKLNIVFVPPIIYDKHYLTCVTDIDALIYNTVRQEQDYRTTDPVLQLTPFSELETVTEMRSLALCYYTFSSLLSLASLDASKERQKEIKEVTTMIWATMPRDARHLWMAEFAPVNYSLDVLRDIHWQCHDAVDSNLMCYLHEMDTKGRFMNPSKPSEAIMPPNL